MDLTSPRSQTPDPPRGTLRKPFAEAPPAYAESDTGVEGAAQMPPPTLKPRASTYARAPRDTHPVPVAPSSPYATNRQAVPQSLPEVAPSYGPGHTESGVFGGRVISVHQPQHPHPSVPETWHPEPYPSFDGHFVASSLRTLPYARTQPPGAETDENATHHRQDRPKHDSPRASPRRNLFSNAIPPPAYATPPATVTEREPLAPATAATRSSTLPNQRVITLNPAGSAVAVGDPRLQERELLVRHNQQLRDQVVYAQTELRRAESQIAEMAGELARLRGQGASSPLASPAISPPYGGGIQPPLRFITNSPPFSPEAASRAPATAAPAEDFRDYRVPRRDMSPPAAPLLREQQRPETRQERQSEPPSPQPQFGSARAVDHDITHLRSEAKEYQRQLESARHELRLKDGIIDTLESENRAISGSMHKILDTLPTSSPERSFVPDRTTFTSPRPASMLTRDRLHQLAPQQPDSPPRSVASDVMHQYLEEQTALVSDAGMSPPASPAGVSAHRRTQYHSEDSEVPLAQKRWKWVTTKATGAGIKDSYPAQYQTRKQRQLVRQIIAGSM